MSFEGSISDEEFSRWKPVKNTKAPVVDDIKNTFIKNKDKAITIDLISKEVYGENNIRNRNKVSARLFEMKKLGEVQHKSPYWKLTTQNTGSKIKPRKTNNTAKKINVEFKTQNTGSGKVER